MYRILALDGGGIRGLVTAILLQRLEQGVPGFLDRVDLIAGTSTGGIIALGLAKGMSPTQLADLYRRHGAEIFDDSWWDDVTDLGRLVGAEYSNRNLQRLLKARFGPRTRLRSLSKQVLVSAFDLHARSSHRYSRHELTTWKPKFFHNQPGPGSDGEALAWKVGLYTSAAPTYFPSYEGYVDGGVVANNPSMAALAQALDSRYPPVPELAEIRILSLGTGLEQKSLPESEDADLDWGYAQWARPLVQLILDGLMDVAAFQCEQILGGDRFHRNAPVFPRKRSYPIDGVALIPKLERFATKTPIGRTLRWLRRHWMSD